MVVRYAVRYIKLRCVLLCIASAALYVLFSYSITAITRVHACQVTVDPLFSHELNVLLRQSCAQLPLGTSMMRCMQHLDELLVHHTSIAAYTIALQVPRTAHITFYAQRPALMVNNEYCVTQQGHAYVCSAMDKNVVMPLPRVRVHNYQHDDRELNQQLLAWIDALPASLLDDYALTWCTATMRYLQPKNASLSYVLVCADTPLTLSRVNACIHTIRQQQVACVGTYHWIADARFAHQIIVKKERIRKIMGVESHA